MKVLGYKILRATNADSLEQLVMQALAAGWTLQGGVSYGAANYMQAVIRTETDKGQSI